MAKSADSQGAFRRFYLAGGIERNQLDARCLRLRHFVCLGSDCAGVDPIPRRTGSDRPRADASGPSSPEDAPRAWRRRGGIAARGRAHREAAIPFRTVAPTGRASSVARRGGHDSRAGTPSRCCRAEGRLHSLRVWAVAGSGNTVGSGRREMASRAPERLRGLGGCLGGV